MFDPEVDILCPRCEEPITVDMLCRDDVICGHCRLVFPNYLEHLEQDSPEDELLALLEEFNV